MLHCTCRTGFNLIHFNFSFLENILNRSLITVFLLHLVPSCINTYIIGLIHFRAYLDVPKIFMNPWYDMTVAFS